MPPPPEVPREARVGPDLPVPLPEEALDLPPVPPAPASTRPWHSVKSKVHHTNVRCTTGRKIRVGFVRDGTGGKPVCRICTKLDRTDARKAEFNAWVTAR